jgi:hypothetical protein
MLIIHTIPLFLFGCGSSDPAPIAYETVQTATYKVEYIPVTTAVDGKSDFKIRVSNKTTGALVNGLTLTLVPMMDMGTMSHSAPVDAVVANGDGTYSSSIYYLMTGAWTLDVKIGAETATFNRTVVASPAITPKATLKGVADTVDMMGMPANRNYYLFNDGVTGGTFKLYIAALNDGTMTSYPPVYVGAALTGLTVTTMTVEASIDGGTTWINATHSGNGHWSVAGISGSSVKVRVTVNGEQKTTDGGAVGATNAVASFTL